MKEPPEAPKSDFDLAKRVVRRLKKLAPKKRRRAKAKLRALRKHRR